MIKRIWDESYSVYGAEKVWCQLRREKVGAQIETPPVEATRMSPTADTVP